MCKDTMMINVSGYIYIFLCKTDLAKEYIKSNITKLNDDVTIENFLDNINIKFKRYEEEYNNIRILIFVKDDEGDSSNTSNKINIIHTSRLSNSSISKKINKIDINDKLRKNEEYNNPLLKSEEQNEESNTLLEEDSFIFILLSFIIELLISLIDESEPDQKPKSGKIKKWLLTWIQKIK